MDLAAEFASVIQSQVVAQKLGANLMGQRVHSWATKHYRNIPLPAFEELMAIITEKA